MVPQNLQNRKLQNANQGYKLQKAKANVQTADLAHQICLTANWKVESVSCKLQAAKQTQHARNKPVEM
jgi:hypothetical protein